MNGIHEVAGSIPASSTKQSSFVPVALLRFIVIEPMDKPHWGFVVC